MLLPNTVRQTNQVPPLKSISVGLILVQLVRGSGSEFVGGGVLSGQPILLPRYVSHNRKCLERTLFDNLQLEENDTIDELVKRHLSICPLSKQSKNLSPQGSNLCKYFMDDPAFCKWCLTQLFCRGVSLWGGGGPYFWVDALLSGGGGDLVDAYLRICCQQSHKDKGKFKKSLNLFLSFAQPF